MLSLACGARNSVAYGRRRNLGRSKHRDKVGCEVGGSWEAELFLDRGKRASGPGYVVGRRYIGSRAGYVLHNK